MAAKILKDVLNNFLSIDSLLEWLSKQCTVSDVNIFINEYKCNQVEFASYFLSFLREQSTMILQSSCTVETPCKNSQLRKIRNIPSEKSPGELKFAETIDSEYKLNFKSLDSYPSLSDGLCKTKSSERSFHKFVESTPKECLSAGEDSSRRCRRVRLFPGKTDHNTNNQESDHQINAARLSNSQSSVTVSSPKSSQSGPIDVSDYFNDVLILDSSSEWSSGFKLGGDDSKSQIVAVDKVKQTCNGGSGIKSKPFSPDLISSRGKNLKSSSRVLLGDFIVNDLSLSENRKEKTKVRKRINPTRVNSQITQFDSSSFQICDSTGTNWSSVAEERELLKAECANVREALGEKSAVEANEKDSIPPRIFSTPTKKVVPTADCVTFVEELKTLSKIYSFILDQNYCQNITMEFCFVMSLLVIQDHTSKETRKELKCFRQSDSQKFLNSVHNCVFFAVEILWLQRNIIALLNLAALKLLSENDQVEKFNPGLKEFLLKAYIERQSREILRIQLFSNAGSRQGNVSFECETDNRDNFPNEHGFRAFRKQRDLFYDILAIWEQNHLSSDWVFSLRLDSKIRSLLSISWEPTNLLHLARLFRNQLVTSCCGDYHMEEDESSEEILQLLASVNPDKVMRLRARLRSTPKRQGPCPLPDFLGYQEFYKDFIISTSHTIFHHYLKNSLCDEILRLNDAEFSSDVEDDDSCLDQQTQNRYLRQINILCLLAKFLGFLEFLPYKTDKLLSDRVLSVHCAVRENLLPLFDLELCLRTAFAKHKLTVTVPWIVSYLSMIDVCSARLKSYQKIWRILIALYWQLKMCKNLMNSFYLKLTLGWIFQLPNFPADLFYNVLEDVTKNLSLELSVEFSVGLDSYNFIEETILYTVCPYLNEINTILTENSGCDVKHIRPVTQGNTSALSLATKQIELRLEECFLHNQSSSTRKTMDFVTERVSSVTVKHLINNIIPKVKDKALKKINDLLLKTTDKTETDDDLDDIFENCYKDLISTCELECWLVCSARTEKALSALLSLDLDAAVSETCTQIVVRQSTEKVKRWIQAHITFAMVKKEFLTIIAKNKAKWAQTLDVSVDSLNSSCGIDASFEVSVQPCVGVSTSVLENSWTFSRVFISFRDMILSIYESGIILWGEINDILHMTQKVLENTEHMSSAVEKSLLSISVDLLVNVCMYSETEMRKDSLNNFFLVFKQLNESSCPGNCLERIICPRNLTLFFRHAKRRCWENLGYLFFLLMEEKLLAQDQVEAQLVSLLRQNWKKNEGVLFAGLFSHILNLYMKHNGCDKFTLLLECLIETLTDNEDSKHS